MLNKIWHALLFLIGMAFAWTGWYLAVAHATWRVAAAIGTGLYLVYAAVDAIFLTKNRPASVRRGVFLIISGAAFYSGLHLLTGCAHDDTTTSHATITAELREYNTACEAGESRIVLEVDVTPPAVEGWNFGCEFDGRAITCTQAVTEDLEARGVIDLVENRVDLYYGHCWWSYQTTGEVWR